MSYFKEFVVKTREFIERVSGDIRILLDRVRVMEQATFVGGRNYVSTFIDGGEYEDFVTISNIFGAMYIGTVSILQSNIDDLWDQDVTLSVVVKHTTHPILFGIDGRSGGVYTAIYTVLPNRSVKMSINFNTADVGDAKIQFKYPVIRSPSTSNIITFGKLMLEKGDLSSEWVPKLSDLYPNLNNTLPKLAEFTASDINLKNKGVYLVSQSITLTTNEPYNGDNITFTMIAKTNTAVSTSSPLKLYRYNISGSGSVQEIPVLTAGQSMEFFITVSGSQTRAMLINTSNIL